MLQIFCDLCHKSLDEPGALIFSPPKDKRNPHNEINVQKLHIGLCCWSKLEDFLWDNKK